MTLGDWGGGSRLPRGFRAQWVLFSFSPITEINLRSDSGGGQDVLRGALGILLEGL